MVECQQYLPLDLDKSFQNYPFDSIKHKSDQLPYELALILLHRANKLLYLNDTETIFN